MNKGSVVMKVKKEILLLCAGIVWLIAGVQILKIAIVAYQNYLSIFHLLISFLIFVIFWKFIFKKMLYKHVKRIMLYASKQYIWKFFDMKSYMIMCFMMTLGICIRNFHLWKLMYIAIFYAGLGSALCLSGCMFLKKFIMYRKEEVL